MPDPTPDPPNDLTDWAKATLQTIDQKPARHHIELLRHLHHLAEQDGSRLLILMPPGSAKSTYAILNMLMGTLAAMATSVVSYWVGSSAGSARKDEHLAMQAQAGRSAT